jgi:hypothetical protein
MGTLPTTTVTQGSLPVIFAAYGVVGLLIAGLLAYGATLWLRPDGRRLRRWRRT